jgi:hypothetical protein
MMEKRLGYLCALAIALGSCHYNDKKITEQYVARLNKPANPVKQLIVEDRSQYSPLFIDSLKRTQYPGSIKLESNYIVVGQDTTRFPADLNPGVTYHFSAQKDAVTYRLDATRINLTDLQFKYTITRYEKLVLQEQGTAMLSPMFFLAAEMPEDDVTGDAYGAYPYRHNTQGHDLEISIGIGRDEHDLLRATLSGTDLKQLNQVIPVLRAK